MGEEQLSLDLLNRATHAWCEQEYHHRVHREIGTTPLKRYLTGPTVRRDCPGSEELRAVFRMQVRRRQRRSDGTVLIEGQRFEIPSRYRHLERVHLRYARWDLSRVDLVDAQRVNVPSSPSAGFYGVADAEHQAFDGPYDGLGPALELTFQTPLYFLPSFLSNFGTIINGTLANSSASYRAQAGIQSTSLPGLSKRSYNAILYYDDHRNSPPRISCFRARGSA